MGSPIDPGRSPVPQGEKFVQKNPLGRLIGAIGGTVGAIASVPIFWVGMAFAAASGLGTGLKDIGKKVLGRNEGEAEDKSTTEKMKDAAKNTLKIFSRPFDKSMDMVVDSFSKKPTVQEHDLEEGVKNFIVGKDQKSPEETTPFKEADEKIGDEAIKETPLKATEDLFNRKKIKLDAFLTNLNSKELTVENLKPSQSMYDSQVVYKCTQTLTCKTGDQRASLQFVALTKKGEGFPGSKAKNEDAVVAEAIEITHKGIDYSIPLAVTIDGAGGHQVAEDIRDRIVDVFKRAVKKELEDNTPLEKAVVRAGQKAYEELFYEPTLLNNGANALELYNKAQASKIGAPNLFEISLEGTLSPHYALFARKLNMQRELDNLSPESKVKLDDIKNAFRERGSPMELHEKLKKQVSGQFEENLESGSNQRVGLQKIDKEVRFGGKKFDISKLEDAKELQKYFEASVGTASTKAYVTMNAFVMVGGSVKCVSLNHGDNMAFMRSGSNLDEKIIHQTKKAQVKVFDFAPGQTLVSASDGHNALAPDVQPEGQDRRGYDFGLQQQFDTSDQVRGLTTEEYGLALIKADMALNDEGKIMDDITFNLICLPQPSEQRV